MVSLLIGIIEILYSWLPTLFCLILFSSTFFFADVSSQYLIGTTVLWHSNFTMKYVERLSSAFMLSRTRVLLTNAFYGTKLLFYAVIGLYIKI